MLFIELIKPKSIWNLGIMIFLINLSVMHWWVRRQAWCFASPFNVVIDQRIDVGILQIVLRQWIFWLLERDNSCKKIFRCHISGKNWQRDNEGYNSVLKEGKITEVHLNYTWLYNDYPLSLCYSFSHLWSPSIIDMIS